MVTLLPCSFAPTFRSRPSGHTDNGHRDDSWRHRSVVFVCGWCVGHTGPWGRASYRSTSFADAAAAARIVLQLARFARRRTRSASVFSRPTRAAAQRHFTARSADWCACSKSNTLQRFDYIFFVRKGGCGVWTKTAVFEARLAVAFIDLFFTIRFFSSFDFTQPQKWACSVQPPPNSWKSTRYV